ncbi:hypothetical protein MTR67_005040 [Solanum verrucosum]|uniref:Uncharacterized protein n=1 Tax=Solanum verrucosum TaxID=315347 RepID=A0AAF0PYU1_SOLVR|nr:hypothetical protein MTR67_005040 [Solanum verrucosum]
MRQMRPTTIFFYTVESQVNYGLCFLGSLVTAGRYQNILLTC